MKRCLLFRRYRAESAHHVRCRYWRFHTALGCTHGFIRARNCACWPSLLDSERCGLRRQLRGLFTKTSALRGASCCCASLAQENIRSMHCWAPPRPNLRTIAPAMRRQGGLDTPSSERVARGRTEKPAPIREAAFASLKAPVRLVQAPADPADASEEREASARRRIPLYDSRKTTARLARSS
jgi:hypothetical protein